MDGSSLLEQDEMEMGPMPSAASAAGSSAGLSEELLAAPPAGEAGEDSAQYVPDGEDWVIKRPDGMRWSTAPANTWALYKLFITIVCCLSVMEGFGSLGCLWVFWDTESWWAFGIALTFLLVSSCLTAIGGTVLNDPQSQNPTWQCGPCLLAFFKMGAFRIAWSTVWFPDRRSIQQEDDLSEHLLPLSLFFLLVTVIESTPLLLIKTYVLGLLLGEVPASASEQDAGTAEHSVHGAAWLMLSLAVSVAFQASVPLLYDKVGTDFRNVFVRGGRTTPFGRQLFGAPHCATLWALRFFEGMAWLLTLGGVAMAAGGWFFMLFFMDLAICSGLACACAATAEEDWELSATFRILFSLFYTNPLHDGDAIMVFRARAPSALTPQPTLLPSALHYGWRAAVQTLVVLWLYLELGGDADVTEPQPNTSLGLAICGAIVLGTLATLATLYVAAKTMPGQEEVAESLLLRRRPDGIPDGLHEAVVEGDVDLYPALGGEESLEVRAWVFREHWYRNRPKGGGRLEMSVDREDVVNSVLDGVSAASPTQLQRGSRVVFDPGEKGIDAGGLTREMYAQFAIGTLELAPRLRIFKETAARNLVPEALTPETYGLECERVYRGYGRICGMALAMGELANFTFAPYFLRQVLLPDSNPSLEERLEELRLDDPVLVGSMQSLLATAAAQMAGEPTAEGGTVEDLCLTFERRMSTSQEVLGEERSVSLLDEAGPPTDVTPGSASYFVERYIEHKMCDSILEQTQAFRGGMLDVLQEPGLLALFTPAELGELLGGTAGIDEVAVARWRAATQLSGCQPDDPSIDAFWGAIGRLTEEERGMVLAFATGCPRLPAVGGTAPNFVISINHHAPLEELPTSSTCTSTLNLPPYVTEELTLERLRLVINVGLTGFGRM